MDVYRERTKWVHIFANPPGVHGRLIATVASAELAKHYLLELYGIPLSSWETRSDVWLSRYGQTSPPLGEESGTYYTIEKLSLVSGLLKPDSVLRAEGEAS
jgi:hypothetical protein